MVCVQILGLVFELSSELFYRAPIPPPRRTKGVRDCTRTLYLLFQTLVGPSLITESQ